MATILQCFLGRFFYWCGILVLVFATIKYVDNGLIDRIGTEDTDLVRSGPRDPAHPLVPMTAYDIYPFSGGHTQADYCAMSGSFCSGDHGFPVSFDLDNPPPKPSKTKRIIVVGGSAAWGHGATSNSRFFSKRLEHKLNASKKCDVSQKFEVINLAQNGSASYQNAIVLNLWGHRLEPDLIISFSGHNDITRMPGQYYRGFPVIWQMGQITQADNSNFFISAMHQQFPGIMRNTRVGQALRLLFAPSAVDDWKNEFQSRFHREHSAADIDLLVYDYLHALKTIKRDFSGIPLMVAFQPYLHRVGNRGRGGLPDSAISSHLANYDHFRKATKKVIQDDPSQEWLVLDLHQKFESEYLPEVNFSGGATDGVHLSDVEHQRVADALFDHAQQLLCLAGH